jgi:GR25 family glycosyltransferase involved in LPS biosynthesis
MIIYSIYNLDIHDIKTIDNTDNIDIPVFLVSLEKDYKRRNDIYKKVTPNAYYGVHGTYLNKELLIQKDILHKDNYTIKKGEIGCYMSHMNLLNEIILTHYKYALIIEDDVDFNKQKIYNILFDIMNDLPNDFDILFLGHNYYETSDSVYSKTVKNYNFKKIKTVHGTHCYLINVNNIRDKLEKLYPIKYPYDIALPIYTNSYIIEQNHKPLVNVLEKYNGYSNTQVL